MCIAWTATVNHTTKPRFDAWLVQDLQPDKLATKPFEPLPVLGVPGWWPMPSGCYYEDTQCVSRKCYYEDVTVFRPKRTV